jgi:hypothetical protein
MLRWLKTVVVSDVEKAHEMRQVGTGKTVPPRSRSKPLNDIPGSLRMLTTVAACKACLAGYGEGAPGIGRHFDTWGDTR